MKEMKQLIGNASGEINYTGEWISSNAGAWSDYEQTTRKMMEVLD